jgi:hypothetical protein
MQLKTETNQAEQKDVWAVNADLARRWPHWAATGALTLLLGGVYLSTLLPGVDPGDAAEIQYMSPLLGVCHPPGYVTEVLCGKLFSLLPLGSNVAWRINFMMAVSGVIGCLALYGVVRRITGRISPALVAATILGFSSIYWSFSLVAEAYVFYGMFLLLGVYTAVRFIATDRAVWLCLTALTLGICVAGRSSELFVMPAFVGLWLGFRRRVRLRPARLAGALSLFALPFVFSVGYFLLREKPAYLHARDDALRDRILGADLVEVEGTGWRRLEHALYYNLGFKWAEQAEFTPDQVLKSGRRYARMLSGIEVFTDRKPPTTPEERNGEAGTSIGAIGLVLALAGAVFYRRKYGWVLLGIGLFVGNLVFYLWHYTWDGLTFTSPGLAGLALLAGLGAAGPQAARRRRGWRMCCAGAGLLMAAILLVTNYPLVDRHTTRERGFQAHCQDVARVPLPPNSVIIRPYSEAMTFRYLLHIEAGRTDVRVISATRLNWRRIARHFKNEGLATFLSPTYAKTLAPSEQELLWRRTPRRFPGYELLLLYPPRAPGAPTP